MPPQSTAASTDQSTRRAAKCQKNLDPPPIAPNLTMLLDLPNESDLWCCQPTNTNRSMASHRSSHQNSHIEEGYSVKRMVSISPSPSRPGSCHSYKWKTIMCHHVRNGGKCRHGSRCNFAHSAKELRRIDENDRSRQLLETLDRCTFKCRPCFDFVATGSCPLGTLCSGIHDERLRNDNQSWWLKNVQYSHDHDSGANDTHVDWGHESKNAEINYGDSSLGPSTLDMFDSFQNFASYICNIREKRSIPPEVSSGSTLSHQRKVTRLTYLQLLHIACQMTTQWRTNSKDTAFKYKPSHIVHGNVCMVVQERAFRKVHGSFSHMVEVTMPPHFFRSQFLNNTNPNIFVVREIVFAHPGKPIEAHCQPALWINTPEAIVEAPSLKVIKRKNKLNNPLVSLENVHEENPFRLFYSRNHEVQNLISEVLWHHFNISTNLYCGSDAAKKSLSLQSTFYKVAKGLKFSHWPVTMQTSSSNLRNGTQNAPPVEGNRLEQYGIDMNAMKRSISAIHHAQLWNSAIANIGNESSNSLKTGQPVCQISYPKRLSIFGRLAEGSPIVPVPSTHNFSAHTSVAPVGNTTPKISLQKLFHNWLQVKALHAEIRGIY